MGMSNTKEIPADATSWRPFTEHAPPWKHKHLIVMVFAHDEPTEVEIFRCRVGERGGLFPENTTMHTILEHGWVPYAWKIDDSPSRDDDKFPPLWADYLCDRGDHTLTESETIDGVPVIIWRGQTVE